MAYIAAISVLSKTQRVALASVLSLDMNISRWEALIERARGRGRCSIVDVECAEVLSDSTATEGLAKAMLDCRITTEVSSKSDVRADAKLDSGVGGKSEPGIGEREDVLSFEGVFVGAEDVAIVSCHLTTLETFPLSPLSSSSVSSNIPGRRRRATISLELVESDRRLSLGTSSGCAEKRRRFRMNALSSLLSIGAGDNKDIDPNASVRWFSG